MEETLELIDFDRKGNAVRLYFGKKGVQIDNYWDDKPYECNAGTVYNEYINGIVDVFFPVDLDIAGPADGYINSEYCKNDFINKKSWVLWIEKEYSDELSPKPVGVFFGDTLAEIKEKLAKYTPTFVEVKND